MSAFVSASNMSTASASTAAPTPNPDAAPRELERAVRELGLKGALVRGRTRERHLDHPSLRPMLAKAAELRVPIFIHPQTPLATVRQANYSGIGGTADLALAAFRGGRFHPGPRGRDGAVRHPMPRG
jgi:predicted TIM-barrel fold metal-dependent hydrolase